MTGEDRAVRALTDVVAVETIAPGMVRVVTWSDAYTVDARDAGCNCPDKQYNEPDMCKHEYSALIADRDDAPTPFTVTDNLSERVMADGGVEREYPGEWEVVDHDRDNHQPADSRSDAEDMKETAEGFGSDNVEILPPVDDDESAETDGGTYAECGICGDDVDIAEARAGPQGVPIHGDCYTNDDTADDTPVVDDVSEYELDDRSVGEDPLEWVPGEFVDEIDGSTAINRKGYEVLSHFYDISVGSSVQVAPENTDHEYCRVKATATMPDGRTCEAQGSAHVDRDDDPWLLLEMADTRARKRALAIATGVGAVAVEELKNEVGA